MENNKIDVKNIVDVAVLNANIINIKADINEIKNNLKDFNCNFCSKEELAVIAKETEKRLERLERASLAWKIFVPAATTILSASFTFLFLQYLQHLH